MGLTHHPSTTKPAGPALPQCPPEPEECQEPESPLKGSQSTLHGFDVLKRGCFIHRPSPTARPRPLLFSHMKQRNKSSEAQVHLMVSQGCFNSNCLVQTGLLDYSEPGLGPFLVLPDTSSTLFKGFRIRLQNVSSSIKS